MRQQLARLGGFGALFIVVFLGGLLLTFPSKLLGKIAEAQLEKQLGFAYDIEVGGARFALPVGVAMTDVSIAEAAGMPSTEDGAPAVPMRPLEIDRLVVTANPLTLASAASGGVPSARAEVRLGDGRVVVLVSPGEEAFADITVHLYDVLLESIPQLAQLATVPLSGSARGTVVLSYSEDQQLAGGSIEFGIAELGIGATTIMVGKIDALPGGIPLVDTDVGTFLLTAEIDGSAMRIDTLEASGGRDLVLTAGGQVDLRSPLSQSLLTVPLEFSLNNDYVERAGFGPILGMIPELSRAQVGDGFALTLSGRLDSLRATPGARGARSR